MTDTATRWPIDYDTLHKGDVIPHERLEHITGMKRTDSKYQLAIVAVAKRIERDMHRLGRTVTVRSMTGSLKVLTDAEASIYNHDGVRRHRRGLLRRHWHNMAVDVSALSGDQKKDHDRYIEVDGRLVQAVLAVKDKPALEPATRPVPGLPGTP